MTDRRARASVDATVEILFWLIAVLCAGCIFFAWYPGVFNADENDILTQALNGRYHDAHSPLLVRLWQLAAFVKVGPAIPYFVAVTSTVVFSALLLRRLLPVAPAACALVVLLFLPPVFASLGLVTKDLFFASAMLAVVLCAATYVERPG